MHAAAVGVRVEGGERLRDRVDAAFVIPGGAERPPVVIVPAPVPRTVPRVLGRARAVVGGEAELFGCVPAHEGGEFPRRDGEKPRQPHALAPALCAHAVKGVVPVAGADPQQPVRPHAAREHAHERPAAVLEHRAALRVRLERLVPVVLVFLQLLAREEGILGA